MAEFDVTENILGDRDLSPEFSVLKLKELANAGSALACWHLGQIFLYGDHVPKNFNEASYWFSLCSKSNSETLYKIGMTFQNQGQNTRAFGSFFEAYKLGYIPAAYQVAVALLTGSGTTRDENKGSLLLEYCSWRGFILAERRYALMMITGKFGFLKILAGFILFVKMAIKTSRFVFAEKSLLEVD